MPRTSKLLSTISPSRVERLLGCPLRLAFEQSNFSSLDGHVSSFAVVGLTVHRAIQLCLEEREWTLDEAWIVAREEMMAVGPNPELAPNARRARLRLEKRLPELLAYIDACEPARLSLEEELADPNGALVGRLDLLVLGKSPRVVDYKTGPVSDDSLPRRSYERQLQLYAWLAAAALNVTVEGAALFSLRQGIVEIDVSKEKQDLAAAQAMQAVSAFNGRVPGSQPASPSEDMCGWCPFLGRCDPAWEALASGDVVRLGWGDAVQGPIRSTVTVSESGFAAVPVEALYGTVFGPTTIIDVPADEVENLSVGKVLSAWSLARRSTQPTTLAWREGISHLQSN